MEKNIASHDVSDMLVYEGMRSQSSRLYIKQKFVHIKKIAEKLLRVFELGGKFTKRTPQRLVYSKDVHFSSTASAVSAICVASLLITFFWLTLLLDATA